MRVPSINQSARRAQQEARKAGEQFFRDNPGRLYWVRQSIPFEHDGWGNSDHLAEPIMLCVRPNTETLKHVTVSMNGKIDEVPNDDRFLNLLWNHLYLSLNGSIIQISPETHRALLEIAGLKPEHL